jgi:uncharacterized protein YndB with AHSA1/START domain
MWKWIVGALLVLVVALFATCYTIFRKATAGGDTVTVAIAASPDRVWASLADPDSMPDWMNAGSDVIASHHGIVVVGDTLHIQQSTRGVKQQSLTWTVSEVTPGHLLVLQMRNDSTGLVLASRRDSLVAAGDSTLIISTIGSPMIDSMRNERGDSGGKLGSFFLDMGSKALVAGFRALSKQDLLHLKARLEGKPLPNER